MTRKALSTRIALIAVAFGALVLLVVPTAFAGKGGGHGGSGSTGSYTATVTPGGPYVFGETIYVTTNAPLYADNKGPWIGLTCYQNGVMVASGVHAGFEGGWYYNWPFTLGPTLSWTAGAGDCTVRVFHLTNNKNVTDAVTSFHVDG